MSGVRDCGGEERARLWLNYAAEYNVRLFTRVEKRFGTVSAALEAFLGGDDAFLQASERVRGRMREAAADGFIDRFLERMERKKISFVCPGETRYPRLLAEISDPPSVLYYIGRLEPDPELAVAIVGSRHPTQYGLDTAYAFAGALARAGAVIVSGLAEGVDASAARGALACGPSGCPTVAVLGTGADVVYPASNAKLYREIIERGAVVSEFLPGARADRIHFPVRNRVMSGMSHGTLIVEAAERSGTSITAGYANEQGRDVFAVPGRIGDAMSAGPNRLIARGEAKAVFSPEDILSEYRTVYEPVPAGTDQLRVPFEALSEDEGRVCRALLTGEKSFDELCETLQMPVGALNSCLTALQFSGIMKQLPGRLYALDASRTVWTEEEPTGGTCHAGYACDCGIAGESEDDCKIPGKPL